MPGFSFSGLFGGANGGIVRGLQYDAQFLRSLKWAVAHNNAPALKELSAIASANLKEFADETGQVTSNTASAVIAAMIGGSDPFQHSRQLMHDFEAKYGKH